MAVEMREPIRLEKAHIKRASLMLTRAFADDQMNAYAYSDTAEREAKMPYRFEVILRYSLRYGRAYATSPQLEGVAVWLRSETASLPFWRLVLSGALVSKLKVGKEVSRRTKQLLGYIGAKHKELVPGSHWYLRLLGVDPEFQGKGHASRLIRVMLPKVDEEGLPCYLETDTERNVAVYEHFGFKVIEEFVVPETTVKFWAMLREPQ
jgi:ribosomal protein S18 acetylase RimI-like enzyme